MSNFCIVQVTYLPVLTTGLIDLELLGKSELARTIPTFLDFLIMKASAYCSHGMVTYSTYIFLLGDAAHKTLFVSFFS